VTEVIGYIFIQSRSGAVILTSFAGGFRAGATEPDPTWRVTEVARHLIRLRPPCASSIDPILAADAPYPGSHPNDLAVCPACWMTAGPGPISSAVRCSFYRLWSPRCLLSYDRCPRCAFPTTLCPCSLLFILFYLQHPTHLATTPLPSHLICHDRCNRHDFHRPLLCRLLRTIQSLPPSQLSAWLQPLRLARPQL
jgi:hypothetical protein